VSDKTIETDVLVIGAGGGGFRAAIGAREEGVKAVLVSKGPLSKCGATVLAGADLTADGRGLRELGFFGEPRDSKETWFSDIVHQGFYLANQKLLQRYVEDAPERIRELLDWGIKVSFSEERAIFTTGSGILRALFREAKRCGVQMIEDMMILDLLVDDGQVTGAIGLDIHTGEFVTFVSKAVVIATGGWHLAYSPTTGTRELSGDGIAMAWRAGATLAHMEFVTFCCNILLWPPHWLGSLFTYILHTLVGGTVTNSEGQRFLDKYDPYTVQVGSSTEWNKAFVSFASAKEIRAGKGSPHGGVYYEVGDIPWEVFDNTVTSYYPGWEYKGVDYSALQKMLRDGEPVEVGPAVEYFEGGISVNEHLETDIRGLYAAGECTAALFGANRVSAATTEMLVTGAVAGRTAGRYASSAGMPGIDVTQVAAIEGKALEPLRRDAGTRPPDLKGHIQRTAHEKLGSIKTKEEIEDLIALLEQVKEKELPELCTSSKSRSYNKEWIEALELHNIVPVLETSAHASLARTESRGVHYRDDYPDTDNDGWIKEVTVKEVDGELCLGTCPITVTTLTPPKGTAPYLEMMKRMMEAHSDVGGHH